MIELLELTYAKRWGTSGGKERLDVVSAIPLIIGGDIFDKWQQPPEMLTRSIQWFRQFKEVWAIPGQHDLPHHEYDQRHKSAYQTLVEAGVIKDLAVGRNLLTVHNLAVWAFPWGYPIESPIETLGNLHSKWMRVCVAHEYVWYGPHKYPDAPKKANIGRQHNLVQYDVACFGDNHKGFLADVESCRVVNNGTFYRRRSDEVNYKPRVHAVYPNGVVEPIYLDTHQDVFGVKESEKDWSDSDHQEAEKFMADLEKLADQSLDFEDAVKRFMDKKRVKDTVRRIVLQCIGKGDDDG